MAEWASGKHYPYDCNFNHTDKLREQIGLLLNCSANHIAIGTNVVDGFSKLLQGLIWKETDEILLIHENYPSIILPFLK